jgi:hypothetical protein
MTDRDELYQILWDRVDHIWFVDSCVFDEIADVIIAAGYKKMMTDEELGLKSDE